MAARRTAFARRSNLSQVWIGKRARGACAGRQRRRRSCRTAGSSGLLTRPQTQRSAGPFALLRRKDKSPNADVCVIVEGAYPYVSGGVSAWVHGVIRRQADLRFCVVAILPEPPPPALKYNRLPNLDALHHLYLSETYSRRGRRGHSSFDEAAFDRAVDAFLSGGGLAELASVDRLIGPLVTARRTGDLLDSTLAWNLVCDL